MTDHLSPKSTLNRRSSGVLGDPSPSASPVVRPVSPRPTTTHSPMLDPDRSKEQDGQTPLFDIDLLAEEARAQDVVQTLSQMKLEVQGWRLIVIMLAIFSGLFLSFLDTSIVAVALATIASQFDAFENSSWVFTAYLLTYMAFGIILARLSDFFGLKTVEAFSLVIFLAFSAACGAAQNMTQMIIFRALQGIGGSGLYSMCTIVSLAAVPADKIGDMATYVSVTQAVAVVLGPILGGVITHDQESENWRWIFYLNLPFCFLALAGLLVAWPKRTRGQDGRPYRLSFKSLEAIDFLGSALLLVACVMLIFSLQQAGAQVFEWNSGVVIESFVISGVAFVAFVIWELVVEGKTEWTLKPIFPLKIVAKRVMASAMIVTVLNGFLWYLIVLNLPNRFQLVDSDNPTIAGVRLLPMVFSAALGTFVAGGLSRKRNLTAYTTILASAIQLLGYGLMTTLTPTDSPRTAAAHTRNTYGFEILLGFGFGMSIASTTLLTIFRFLAEPQHTAVMQGCITQMRSLGGSIGLSISTVIFNHYVHSSVELTEMLSSGELEDLYRSPLVIETFDREQQAEIAWVYSRAFRMQMRVAMYVAAAALVVSFGCVEGRGATPHPPGKEDRDRRRESVEAVNYS